MGNRGGEIGGGGQSLCPQVGGLSLNEVNQKSRETLKMDEVALSYRWQSDDFMLILFNSFFPLGCELIINVGNTENEKVEITFNPTTYRNGNILEYFLVVFPQL